MEEYKSMPESKSKLKSESKPKPKSRWQTAVNWVGWFVADQWFIFAIALVIVISSQVQVPLNKQHLRQTIVTYGCVAVIFLFTGMTLETRVLIENYYRWPTHIFIQVQCFLLTSAISFAVVSATATNHHFMNPGLLVGMVLMGCLPTTLSSNVVMTSQAHGNTALTVVQTTIGNFLGPFVSPLLFRMYMSAPNAWFASFLSGTGDGGLDEVYRRVFKQLGLSVYMPLVVGQVVQNLFPATTNRWLQKYKLKKVNSIALLLVIWQTFDQAFATHAFNSVPPSNIIYIVFINIALYLVWLAFSLATSVPWLHRRDVVSVAYCVPAKTPAMGVPLANVMYAGLSLLQESQLQIPMVLFQMLQISFSSLLTIAFRRWVDRSPQPQPQPQHHHHHHHHHQQDDAVPVDVVPVIETSERAPSAVKDVTVDGDEDDEHAGQEMHHHEAIIFSDV